ncbi:hypothetical protein HY212_05355 [Candidatus Pacearchaeota archaeon]|nr:hypothetical protein [Candidatus Pacearchaeota archaeon]
MITTSQTPGLSELDRIIYRYMRIIRIPKTTIHICCDLLLATDEYIERVKTSLDRLFEGRFLRRKIPPVDDFDAQIRNGWYKDIQEAIAMNTTYDLPTLHAGEYIQKAVSYVRNFLRL